MSKRANLASALHDAGANPVQHVAVSAVSRQGDGERKAPDGAQPCRVSGS